MRGLPVHAYESELQNVYDEMHGRVANCLGTCDVYYFLEATIECLLEELRGCRKKEIIPKRTRTKQRKMGVIRFEKKHSARGLCALLAPWWSNMRCGHSEWDAFEFWYLGNRTYAVNETHLNWLDEYEVPYQIVGRSKLKRLTRRVQPQEDSV